VERREAGAEARTAVRAGTVGEAGEAAHAASRDRGMLVGWLAALLVGVAAFHALGDGALALPPVTDPGSWGTWASTREPLVATVALLRLLVLALAWYLVGVTTVGTVARLTRAARLVRIADALTLPAVRRLLQGALGVGLATAMVGAAAPVPRVVPAPTGALASDLQLVRAETSPGAPARPLPLELLDTDPGGEELVLRRVTEDADGPSGVEDGPPTPETAEPAEPVAVEPADPVSAGHLAADPAEHEVVAGESLWTIARDAVAADTDRPPTDAEVHRYWEALIERNRDRLADADNPDLIFPGQRFELPPAPDHGWAP
jgi:hypothetical protein